MSSHVGRVGWGVRAQTAFCVKVGTGGSMVASAQPLSVITRDVNGSIESQIKAAFPFRGKLLSLTSLPKVLFFLFFSLSEMYSPITKVQ